MDNSNKDKLDWTMVFIYEFGKRFGLTVKQSFNYLSRFKGIDFIDKHYGYAHTQSFESMIDDIAMLCRRMGGQLQ
ncbi:MAG: DUF3791 domain-containing protein [Sodaliphilus pleomorphus]|jgi:hypothetical protein|uniref:DUF3791 domain-containing protein n=1 Tax=Sodaliphilus pleomorphus TaxID=2606626 RepID=UPI0023F57464|nr:DUF3791 domain-containing protein [Sodaliphilus pleomorphus]MDD7065500.1 DUF3791 domain-containing protein [Sodaliphilus pleomorphus]MDY2831839.1 DUF3791 domain-containing protein [Sodaliphilus pleomorphus]